VKTWKSQGGMFKKHVGQGKVRELFFGYSFLYMSNYYTLREKTNYKNKTAGSMLCHNSLAANTYKESFTLYSTPQKGREGILFTVIGIAKPT